MYNIYKNISLLVVSLFHFCVCLANSFMKDDAFIDFNYTITFRRISYNIVVVIVEMLWFAS